MFSFLFGLVAMVTVTNTNVSTCETVGPRIDGISVEICDGHAVKYTDATGNVIVPSDY